MIRPSGADGVQLLCEFVLFYVIASSSFPRIPLGASSGLGAFGATPKTPHLGCLLEPSEHHRAAHHFGDMLSKIIGFSNHAVIVAEEQHQTI